MGIAAMSSSGAADLEGDFNTKIAECAVAIDPNPRDALSCCLFSERCE
jgi:hypothetical protein